MRAPARANRSDTRLTARNQSPEATCLAMPFLGDAHDGQMHGWRVDCWMPAAVGGQWGGRSRGRGHGLGLVSCPWGNDSGLEITVVRVAQLCDAPEATELYTKLVN